MIFLNALSKSFGFRSPYFLRHGDKTLVAFGICEFWPLLRLRHFNRHLVVTMRTTSESKILDRWAGNLIARIAKYTIEIVSPVETCLSMIFVHARNPFGLRIFCRGWCDCRRRRVRFSPSWRGLCHSYIPSLIAASQLLCLTHRNGRSVVITAISIGPPQV